MKHKVSSSSYQHDSFYTCHDFKDPLVTDSIHICVRARYGVPHYWLFYFTIFTRDDILKLCMAPDGNVLTANSKW